MSFAPKTDPRSCIEEQTCLGEPQNGSRCFGSIGLLEIFLGKLGARARREEAGVGIAMSISTAAFAPGDVLQTEPQPGFWGCAVVLSATPGTAELNPSFHVAVTPVIYRHAFLPSEIDMAGLSVLVASRSVRVAPNEYMERAAQPCIGVYTAKSRGDVRVLGTVNPLSVWPTPLGPGTGNGTDGAFPLCGPLTRTIGWEAVVAWRRIHDAVALAEEVLQGRQRFESFEQERLAQQRESRTSRSGVKRRER